ncbi:hypothetical protein C8A05DRAFT_29353 [Staphylotrichum tortipilum]|uniref:F-box domain-containing protein n=1 Tax=Staphylotrichum tortipilum TaxID=2831512 RepID=A0AAN6MUN6_9PEZI|nr:hypothetical protein C8A05DRAFT_29353 [Staphylotrichum longicolle]
MRDLTELPHDLFLVVLWYLPPRACVRCRGVSRAWHAAFTTEHVSLLLLRWNFPRCRELRLAAAAGSISSCSPSTTTATTTTPADVPRNLRAELTATAGQPRNWPATFAEVTRRYYHLDRGLPRIVEKLELATNERESEGGGDGRSGFSFWSVAPWNRFLRLNGRTSNFHYPDPVWWYSQEDGVLVYPAAAADPSSSSTQNSDAGPGGENSRQPGNGFVYHIVDLATGQLVPVPFDVRSRHIRRVRLAQGVLVLEWAEALPYHQLNDREVVHRHFVTAFDVIRKPCAGSPGTTWTVEFRSEWKLHFLGLPLNRSDRFFSTHTATHYAVYFWQPNRSLYQDDPIEQLAVWDISTPSPYRPSEDPRGDKRPTPVRTPSLPPGLWSGRNGTAVVGTNALAGSRPDLQRPRRPSLAIAPAGPRVIRRMAWRELDFYGLRQRATPRLRCLALEGQDLYVIEEEHRWADGQHSSLSPPRVHLVRSTGIPVVPIPGPLPKPAYPSAARSTTDLSDGMAQLLDSPADPDPDGPVHGPMWLDSCGANGDVNMNFCWRVADPDRTTTANTTIQTSPTHGTWIATPLAPTQEHLNDDQPRPRSSTNPAGWPWTVKAGGGSQNEPATRWPGWAPCWRHEDFPYLTVAEMVDFAAGVRVTARHCFMLESLSVHVRPAVAVKGTPSSAVERERDEGRKGVRRGKGVGDGEGKGKGLAARSREVYFPDEMWGELVGKGVIMGDERWIVGEDGAGRVTVVRF